MRETAYLLVIVALFIALAAVILSPQPTGYIVENLEVAPIITNEYCPHKPQLQTSGYLGCAKAGDEWDCQLKGDGDITIGEVQGTSMDPTLLKGDLVLIQKDADYTMCDIIAYTKGDELVMHRVIELSPCVKTKGDANPYADTNCIDKENIVGKAVVVIKGAAPGDYTS